MRTSSWIGAERGEENGGDEEQRRPVLVLKQRKWTRMGTNSAEAGRENIKARWPVAGLTKCSNKIFMCVFQKAGVCAQ